MAAHGEQPDETPGNACYSALLNNNEINNDVDTESSAA